MMSCNDYFVPAGTTNGHSDHPLESFGRYLYNYLTKHVYVMNYPGIPASPPAFVLIALYWPGVMLSYFLKARMNEELL